MVPLLYSSEKERIVIAGIKKIKIQDSSVFENEESFDVFVNEKMHSFIEGIHYSEYGRADDNFTDILTLWENRLKLSSVKSRLQEQCSKLNETEKILGSDEFQNLIEVIPQLSKFLGENLEKIIQVPEIRNAVNLSNAVSQAFNFPRITLDELQEQGVYSLNRGVNESIYEMVCRQELIKKEIIESKIHEYDGIILRSRFTIDKQFLDAATSLKFIGRVGAGLENIDCIYAKKKGITLIAAPEGNRNAVGEHALGMVLSLLNKLNKADAEVKEGKWLREDNRGVELDGKTVGIIGYGNMGKAFAKKLRGFEVEVLCYDIKQNVSDENAKQVSLYELQQSADVLSLHTPQTPLTLNLINTEMINVYMLFL